MAGRRIYLYSSTSLLPLFCASSSRVFFHSRSRGRRCVLVQVSGKMSELESYMAQSLSRQIFTNSVGLIS